VTETSEIQPLSRKELRRLREKKKKKFPLALKIFLIVLIIIIITAASIVGYAEYRYHQIHLTNVKGLKAEIPGQPINILLVGNNSRCVLNGQQASQFGTCSEVGGARSDVTMLLHINPKTNQVSILSIPRDMFVHIPDFKNSAPGRLAYAKIDAALNNGPSDLVDTIEQDFNIPIQHYVSLNFDTFQNVVNALGGLYMYFPTPVYDLKSGLNITSPGCKYLNGTQALELVRARMLYYKTQQGTWQYDGNGDISRIVRVHEFLKVLAKSVEPKIKNPFTANAILGSVLPDLQVDSRFSLTEMAALGWKFHNLNVNSVPTLTLPSTPISSYYFQGANFGDVVFPVQPADQQVIDQFLGQTAPQGVNINPSTITVTVLNGSGSYYRTQKVANELSALGFDVVSVGTAPTEQATLETTVYYSTPQEQPAAQELLGYLQGTAIMGQTSEFSTNSDLTLVVGNEVNVSQTPSFTILNSGQSTTTTSSMPTQSNTTTATTTTSTQTTNSPTPTYSTGPLNPAQVYPATEPLPYWDPRACPKTN